MPVRTPDEDLRARELYGHDHSPDAPGVGLWMMPFLIVTLVGALLGAVVAQPSLFGLAWAGPVVPLVAWGDWRPLAGVSLVLFVGAAGVRLLWRRRAEAGTLDNLANPEHGEVPDGIAALFFYIAYAVYCLGVAAWFASGVIFIAAMG